MAPERKSFNHSDGVSLKEHFDQRLVDLQRAVDKAELTMNSRLEGMNEFREAMKDMQKTLATKSDFEELRRRLKSLESIADQATGKADSKDVTRVTMFAIAGLLLSIISIVLGLFGV